MNFIKPLACLLLPLLPAVHPVHAAGEPEDEVRLEQRVVQVNNAGVLITGPSAEVGLAPGERLFDVNVFGVYRVTQAFAPLIVASRGRIVNIGSIAGHEA